MQKKLPYNLDEWPKSSAVDHICIKAGNQRDKLKLRIRAPRAQSDEFVAGPCGPEPPLGCEGGPLAPVRGQAGPLAARPLVHSLDDPDADWAEEEPEDQDGWNMEPC